MQNRTFPAVFKGKSFSYFHRYFYIINLGWFFITPNYIGRSASTVQRNQIKFLLFKE